MASWIEIPWKFFLQSPTNRERERGGNARRRIERAGRRTRDAQAQGPAGEHDGERQGRGRRGPADESPSLARCARRSKGRAD
jgi:hypothetical protein